MDRGLHPLAVTFANHPLEIIAPGRAPLLLSTPDEKLSLFAETVVEAEIIPFDDSLRLTSASGFLHMLNSYKLHEVTYMKAVGSRVESGIKSYALFAEKFI